MTNIQGKNCLAPRFRHATSYSPRYTIGKRELHRGTCPDSPSSWHCGAGWRTAKAIMRCLNKHRASMKKLISCAFNQPSWSKIMTIFESQWHGLLVLTELSVSMWFMCSLSARSWTPLCLWTRKCSASIPKRENLTRKAVSFSLKIVAVSSRECECCWGVVGTAHIISARRGLCDKTSTQQRNCITVVLSSKLTHMCPSGCQIPRRQNCLLFSD